jgi:hypothetical protein
MVLDDAWKVAVIRATAKVVIFATHKGRDCQEKDRQTLVDDLSALRMQSRDYAPWLWIDLPWIESNDYPRNIAFGILTPPAPSLVPISPPSKNPVNTP